MEPGSVWCYLVTGQLCEWYRLPREIVEFFVLGDLQNVTGCIPGKPALADTALRRGVGFDKVCSSPNVPSNLGEFDSPSFLKMEVLNAVEYITMQSIDLTNYYLFLSLLHSTAQIEYFAIFV